MNPTLSPGLPAAGGARALDPVLVARRPRPRIVSGRLVGLVVLTATVAAFLAYMVVNVPVVAPMLSRAGATRHWEAALSGVLAVAAVVLVVAGATLRSRRAHPPAGQVVSAPSSTPGGAVPRARVPRPLRWQGVPRWAVALAALTSLALVATVVAGDYPLWLVGLALLLPWSPLVTVEAAWKYERYGAFGFFAMLVLLQLVHMGEHTVQVTQLMLTQGDLGQSHGVFGQLDFELVHFVSDSGVWLCLGLLLYAFRGENRWLWVAFAAASLHEIEHLYLFWLNTFDQPFYAHGGFAGIMGHGGLIGSPLDRPYLHFAYNVIVVVPMTVALWDEARRVEDRFRPAR